MKVFISFLNHSKLCSLSFIHDAICVLYITILTLLSNKSSLKKIKEKRKGNISNEL